MDGKSQEKRKLWPHWKPSSPVLLVPVTVSRVEAGDLIAEHIDADWRTTACRLMEALLRIQALEIARTKGLSNIQALILRFYREDRLAIKTVNNAVDLKGIIDGTASHQSLPFGAGTLVPEEPESGNQQLKGLSQEKHGQWPTSEVIPTSGDVGHQEGPAGIDGSKALNELHSPEGITEEHKSENHQLKGLSLEELNQWLTDVIFPTLGNVGHQKGIISSAKREEIAAHISPNFNNYRDTIGEVELAIEALRFIEDLTRIKVNHVGELPVLKTPEDFRYFVGNQALEVLDKINEVRPQPAKGPLGMKIGL
ncbi:hypothetical protein KEM48_014254 [Puccinia striiformis f. sp. tritici PST-130]|nr:hypothetical protein KEM48_014254 [Puccinia striiformis f. sp. tritici PST-130]